jgi:hypothetical protein
MLPERSTFENTSEADGCGISVWLDSKFIKDLLRAALLPQSLTAYFVAVGDRCQACCHRRRTCVSTVSRARPASLMFTTRERSRATNSRFAFYCFHCEIFTRMTVRKDKRRV